MKNKWHRNGWVKAIVILLSYVTIVVAAFDAAVLLNMARVGITLESENEDYTESGRFRETFHSQGYQILNGLRGQNIRNLLDTADDSTVVDIGEYRSDLSVTVEQATRKALPKEEGLLYSLKELKALADGWNGVYNGGGNKPILSCKAEDGTYHYYYFDEFVNGLLSGKLQVMLNDEVRYAREWTWDREGNSNQFALLNDYPDVEEMIRYAASMEMNLGEVIDTEVKDGSLTKTVQYVSCEPFINYNAQLLPETGIGEICAPKGYANLLEFLNQSPQWNDRIEDAYMGLHNAISEIQSYQRLTRDDELKWYEKDKTNITYLYANRDTGELYSNVFEDYKELEKILADIPKETAHYVMFTSAGDFETNISRMEEYGYNESLMNHASFVSKAKDYVFLMYVDDAFPVEDTFRSQKELYETHAGRMRPMLIQEIWMLVLWLALLVWLTLTAGRNSKDEEVHLIWFDRIFTEIAAVSVAGIWLLVFLFGIQSFELVTGQMGSIVFEKMKYMGVWIPGLAVYTETLFLFGWLSLVRRIKARTIWKNSLLRWCLRWLVKLWKAFCQWCKGLVNWVKATVYGKDILIDGLKRISGGEIQYKIPLEKVNGKRRVMAEYINNIGDGLDAAVEKTMRSERMKTDLITNVSHDIKTPLTSIINYVDLLKRENFTDPKIQGYLQVLDEKSQRLKVLTEDVVEASKASSGNINLEMTELDFVELIHQVLGEFEEKFQQKNLTMMVHFEDEASVIYADGQRMWRVLSNIFGNVVKYAMEGTRVYAEVHNKDKKVIFSLKNISAQPLNISPDELTERFIRGDVSRNTEGSGLGLSIAKSLTELQGGEFKLFVDGDLFKVVITFAVKKK